MIGQLTGVITFKGGQEILLDVEGVGYEVTVPSSLVARLPEEGARARIFVHTHVTEASLTLYGFLTAIDRVVFRKLISVSGIGPKSALQILSGLSIGELVKAVRTENLFPLTAISGVGKKTAERIILELKDKLNDLAGESSETGRAATVPVHANEKTATEVVSALMNLGYNRSYAERAIAHVAIRPQSTVEEVLRESLTILGR